MKKKILIIILLVIILGTFSYVFFGKINIHNKMEAYLEHRGYKKSEIKSIEIKHSFMNVVLSYDEWDIWVRYNDEPNSIYFYIYKKGIISPTGISGVPDGKIYKHGDPEPIEKSNVEKNFKVYGGNMYENH